jgi:hypothetical protein
MEVDAPEDPTRFIKTVEHPVRYLLDSTTLFPTDSTVNLAALKEHFRREGRLRKADVERLLQMASDIFREEDNVVSVSSPITSKSK